MGICQTLTNWIRYFNDYWSNSICYLLWITLLYYVQKIFEVTLNFIHHIHFIFFVNDLTLWFYFLHRMFWYLVLSQMELMEPSDFKGILIIIFSTYLLNLVWKKYLLKLFSIVHSIRINNPLLLNFNFFF